MTKLENLKSPIYYSFVTEYEHDHCYVLYNVCTACGH
jgi:hypothetical protein